MSKFARSKVHNHIINNPMCTFYELEDLSALEKFFNVVSAKGFTNWFNNLFNKASDSISSLRAYPIKQTYMSMFGSTVNSNIKIGKELWNIPSYILVNSGSTPLITIAEYNIPAPTSFIDFEPFTTMQLYIPYMDFIDLPVNEIVGKKLYVKYGIDLPSGTATAFIETLDKNGDRYVLAIKSGKIGVDVAWGRDNSLENTRNILNTAISTTIGIVTTVAGSYASGGALTPIATVGIGATLGKGALSVSQSLQTKYERGGNVGSVASLLAPNSVYLIIKKPKLVPVDETDYAHTYGKPLYESRVLAQVSGFTVVDEIHLTGFPDAMEEEVNEIERLLKEGVHL